METKPHICCVLGSETPHFVGTAILISWLKMSRKFTPKYESLEFQCLGQGFTHPDLRVIPVEEIV